MERASREHGGGAFAPLRYRRPPPRAAARCATGHRRRAPPATRGARPRNRRARVRQWSRPTGSISRRSASSAMNASAVNDCSARCTSDAQQQVAGVLQRLDGTRAGGRRVVDLVGQTGRQCSEGDERLRAGGTASPWCAPFARYRPSCERRKETMSRPVAQRRAPATRSKEPVTRGARRWRDTPRRRPTRGTRRPTRPAAPSHHDDRLLVPGAPHELDPAREQHPERLRRITLDEQHVAGLKLNLFARRSARELLVAQPFEQEDGRSSSTSIRSSPGNGGRGIRTSRLRRQPTRPASWSRAARRRPRTRRARWSRARTGRVPGASGARLSGPTDRVR